MDEERLPGQKFTIAIAIAIATCTRSCNCNTVVSYKHFPRYNAVKTNCTREYQVQYSTVQYSTVLGAEEDVGRVQCFTEFFGRS